MIATQTQRKASQPCAPAQSSHVGTCDSSHACTPTHEQIAQRAFDLYVASCCKQGQCKENWYQAERQLTHKKSETSAPKAEVCCKS